MAYILEIWIDEGHKRIAIVKTVIEPTPMRYVSKPKNMVKRLAAMAIIKASLTN